MKGPDPLKSRDRVLSDDEIAAFWRATERMGGVFAPIFQLALLTGQRREELRGMRWGTNWTSIGRHGRYPESAAKTASRIVSIYRLRRSPSSATPVEPYRRLRFRLLHDGRNERDGFSNAKERLDVLMAEEFGKPVKPWRIHDLRRTAASGMAGLGFAPQVIERVLNHVCGARSKL